MQQTKLATALRLILSTGASNREIGKELDIAYNTIRRYRSVAQENQLGLDDLDSMDETTLSNLFNRRGAKAGQRRVPDWAHVHRELQRKGVTRTLLWVEYKDEDPTTAYELSRFNELYAIWAGKRTLSMRQQYEPGERGFVDFSGTRMTWVDPASGECHAAELFVASAGVGGLLFGYAVPSQREEHWIEAHCQWYAFLDGVPMITVPDNLKAAVIKAGREPVLNPAYVDMAKHYGTLILPARAGHPKDKSLAEGGVLIFKRWVIARLRNHVFYSLDELNQAILECANLINDRQMRRYKQSRRERFETIDRSHLKALPPRYEYCTWVGPLRVPPDYHIAIDGHFYSVPYRFVQQQVHARHTCRTVEIMANNVRIASHPKSGAVGSKTTERTHMPEHHLAWADHTPDRYMAWASMLGPDSTKVIEMLLEDARHPAAALNACASLQKLARRHTNARFELACARALAIKSPTVKSIRSILQNGLEQQRLEAPAQRALPRHENVRGAQYFQAEGNSHAD